MPFRRASFAVVGTSALLVMALLMAACGTSATPTPTPSPTPDFDSEAAMFRIFSGLNHPPQLTLQALEEARDHNVTSLVPVIMEYLRFAPSEEVVTEMEATLIHLTGQQIRGGLLAWDQWMEWLGNNLAGYQPPEGYVRWKINLLVLIDPRFALFLAPAITGESRVDVTELVWGGVAPDGIPDIQDPIPLAPEEADYILSDDRVFGVSINGEHRAYPLRIVNAHEMANDTLGGEPIALAY